MNLHRLIELFEKVSIENKIDKDKIVIESMSNEYYNGYLVLNFEKEVDKTAEEIKKDFIILFNSKSFKKVYDKLINTNCKN